MCDATKAVALPIHGRTECDSARAMRRLEPEDSGEL